MNCPWCSKPMELRKIPIKDTNLPNNVKIANFDKAVLVYICFNNDCSEFIRKNKKN